MCVHANQITAWKAQLVDGAAEVFGSGAAAKEAPPIVDLKTLHAKLGELTLERVESGRERPARSSFLFLRASSPVCVHPQTGSALANDFWSVRSKAGLPSAKR
jgi:hypothetical protein